MMTWIDDTSDIINMMSTINNVGGGLTNTSINICVTGCVTSINNNTRWADSSINVCAVTTINICCAAATYMMTTINICCAAATYMMTAINICGAAATYMTINICAVTSFNNSGWWVTLNAWDTASTVCDIFPSMFSLFVCEYLMTWHWCVII